MEHARAAMLAHKKKHASFSFNRHEDAIYVCSKHLMIDEVPGDGDGE